MTAVEKFRAEVSGCLGRGEADVADALPPVRLVIRNVDRLDFAEHRRAVPHGGNVRRLAFRPLDETDLFAANAHEITEGLRFAEDIEKLLPSAALATPLQHQGSPLPEVAPTLRIQRAKLPFAVAPDRVHHPDLEYTDDHLRNHAFLYEGQNGWRLAPAYDLNPVPADIKTRVLVTAITEDDNTASLALAFEVAGYFEIAAGRAREIAAEVAAVVSMWRAEAGRHGIARQEIDRMASAFEHQDLEMARGR